jgi:chorismate mutase
MPIRGIRGATVAAADTAKDIRAATRELLLGLIEANGLHPEDVASVFFSVTPDLSAEAPARAARELGWDEAAMLCLAEMPVPGMPERCIRVLIHWNTELRPNQVHHVYLHAAAQLRPDRASTNGTAAAK